jgi:hypothetical protein
VTIEPWEFFSAKKLRNTGISVCFYAFAQVIVLKKTNKALRWRRSHKKTQAVAVSLEDGIVLSNTFTRSIHYMFSILCR